MSPDGTSEVAGLFDFGGLIALLTGHADVTDQLVDSTPSDLVGTAEDPAGPQTKHIRVRQVIGVLTFAFSSANGQDKTETDRQDRPAHHGDGRWRLLAAQRVPNALKNRAEIDVDRRLDVFK